MCVVHGAVLSLLCSVYSGQELKVDPLPKCVSSNSACKEKAVINHLAQLDSYRTLNRPSVSIKDATAHSEAFSAWEKELVGRCGVSEEIDYKNREEYAAYLVSNPEVGRCVMQENAKRMRSDVFEYRQRERKKNRERFGVPTGISGNHYFLSGEKKSGKYMFEFSFNEQILSSNGISGIYFFCQNSDGGSDIGALLVATGVARDYVNSVSIAVDFDKGQMFGALEGEWGRHLPELGVGPLSFPSDGTWRCGMDANAPINRWVDSGEIKINLGHDPFIARDGASGFKAWQK